MSFPIDDPVVDQAVATLVDRATGAYRRGPFRPVHGVSLGGCVDAHGTTRVGAMRRSAHAHTSGRHLGWICVKSAKVSKLVTPGGLATTLLAHEWAHIALNTGHSAAWRSLMTAIGHAREANRYAVRAARRAAWIKLVPEVHMTDPDGVLAGIRAATPDGHVVDMEGRPERGGPSAMYGGGRYGYIVKYRYLRGS
jgi:hypothetical protein